MDPDRARELLSDERARVERAIADLDRDGPLESTGRIEPGDRGSEDLYEDELAQGRRETLLDALAAVERAETRLAAGTYGLSVESGDPIPDERLKVLPAAERTVDEERRRR